MAYDPDDAVMKTLMPLMGVTVKLHIVGHCAGETLGGYLVCRILSPRSLLTSLSRQLLLAGTSLGRQFLSWFS